MNFEELLKGGEYSFVVKFDIPTSILLGVAIGVFVLIGGWIARRT